MRNMATTSSNPKWVIVPIAPGLIRVDVHEESLGDEWRGSVLLDEAQCRKFATDLARAAGEAANIKVKK